MVSMTHRRLPCVCVHIISFNGTRRKGPHRFAMPTNQPHTRHLSMEVKRTLCSFLFNPIRSKRHLWKHPLRISRERCFRSSTGDFSRPLVVCIVPGTTVAFEANKTRAMINRAHDGELTCFSVQNVHEKKKKQVDMSSFLLTNANEIVLSVT